MQGLEVFRLAVPNPPAQLAQALLLVEAAILDRDIAARARQHDAVREAERRAAATACVVLEQAIERLDLGVAELEAAVGDNFPATVPNDYLVAVNDTSAVLNAACFHANTSTSLRENFAVDQPFSEVERVLLQLAGLSEELARSHTAAALKAFKSANWDQDLAAGRTLHQAVMRRVRRGRDAVCAYSEQLEADEAQRLKAAASRKRMRRVTKVLGGVLIGGTNVAASMLLGPLAAAASTVIGAAASDILDIATGDDL